ncbi:MAG: fibrillarin-like rRNA/tRNA 2'-O-methyltransferase [Thermoplasmata archaeon]
MPQSEWPGVFRRGRELYTRNLRPGERVYGEELIVEDGVEYRHWDPWRSKLAAYLLNGASRLPFEHPRRVLYLGAAHGTTISHLSDLLPDAQLFGIEKSGGSFGAFLALSHRRPNLYPILADAQLPERYQADVGPIDFLYQDIAQRNQADVFAENATACLAAAGSALLMLKVRSVTQRRSVAAVVTETRSSLTRQGLRVVDQRTLAPFSRDHVALAVSRA